MDDILEYFDAASFDDKFAVLKVLSIGWLSELYDALPTSECEALDQVISDQCVCNLKSLLDTLQIVETYFQER